MMETCRGAVETAEGQRHNAVMLKVRCLQPETMKPGKKFKNKNHSIIYLIPLSGYNTSLK